MKIDFTCCAEDPGLLISTTPSTNLPSIKVVKNDYNQHFVDTGIRFSIMHLFFQTRLHSCAHT